MTGCLHRCRRVVPYTKRKRTDGEKGRDADGDLQDKSADPRGYQGGMVEYYSTWRSDLSKAERINEKPFVEYTKDGFSTIFSVINVGHTGDGNWIWKTGI